MGATRAAQKAPAPGRCGVNPAGPACCLPTLASFGCQLSKNLGPLGQPSHLSNLVGAGGIAQLRGRVHPGATQFWVRKQTRELLLSGKETLFRGQAAAAPTSRVASESPFQVNSPKLESRRAGHLSWSCPKLLPLPTRRRACSTRHLPAIPRPSPGWGAPGPRDGAGIGRAQEARGGERRVPACAPPPTPEVLGCRHLSRS